MQGLKLTYQILAESRNEAAVDVLIMGLDSTQSATRRFALESLLSREEPRARELLLTHWSKLQPDDIRVIRPRKKWIAEAVTESLQSGGDDIATAIEAAETLELTAVFPDLVLLAESSATHSVRQRATQCVIRMAATLGADARIDRGQPTVRRPIVARLADSIRRFTQHRSTQLIDAFLLVSTWGDADLRELLSGSGKTMEMLCARLFRSDEIGVIELLAGFIRRRKVDPRIMRLIAARDDERFREALLRQIGSEPTATTLRNLSELGLPKSCRGGEALLDEIPPEYRAPLIHLYTAAGSDCLETLHVISAVIERGGPPSALTAAALALSRCEIPHDDFFMRAAVPVAEDDQEAIESDSNAYLLSRLIDLLDHSDPGIVKGVRRVLQPLHAEAMLPRFESLRPRSRRRLGKVVMMIDPDAIQRVRDALRHPVLSHRLEAIATADALAAVDLLSDSFERIAREDHQEARMRAADVMGDATGDVTLQLLQEMVDLPECPVRDTAIEALQRRQTASGAT